MENPEKPKYFPEDSYPKETPPLEIKKRVFFEHTFSNGAKLIVEQGENQKASVRIEGKKKIDFNDLIAPGYAFKISEEENRSESINPISKKITIGIWTSPKDLLGLLHEIGHSFQPYLTEMVREKHFGPQLTEVQQMKRESKSERDAWAIALKIMKKLQKELGFPIIREIFSSLEEIREYIRSCLKEYREERLRPYFQEVKSESGRARLEPLFPDSQLRALINSLYDKPKRGSG